MTPNNAWNQLRKYPSAIAGLIFILAMVALSGYTLVTLPYHKAIELWRGGEGVWVHTPRNAAPQWINVLPGINRSESILLDSARGDGEKRVEVYEEDFKEAIITLPIDFRYDTFPQEISLVLSSEYESKRPFVTLTWVTPDGRTISLGERSPRSGTDMFRISQDARLQRQLRGELPHIALFADPEATQPKPAHGTYQLLIEGLLFESAADLDARLIVYGEVYGLAGTDHRRRDLTIALLWGAPIALSFGLLAAVGSTITTLIVAAIGTWYGGWVDALIQRITEVNLILPVLPILIMVGTFYSRSIWMMLGVLILLGIFSAGVKTYRALFLQIRESPYIEAARAYGAGNLRIVFRYMIPRVIPILVPQFVVIIPAYVFLEATLSVLGLGDPVLPTWGKVLDDARANGALYNGHYYWMLEPAALLMFTGLGFAMLGFALDRIFNPRLRGR